MNITIARIARNNTNMMEEESLLGPPVDTDDESVNILMESKAKLAWDRAKKKGFTYCNSFKKFINERGDILSLAVALIVAASFQKIVQSLVDDILMPPFGLIPGTNLENWFYVIRHGANTTAGYHTVKQAQSDGAVTINIGIFVLTIINFLIIALSLWLLVMLATGIKERIRIQHEAVTTKTCPACCELVKIKAIKCKYCLTELQ